jgi:RNA polymerase sigma-70 factor, ECF subfamily
MKVEHFRRCRTWMGQSRSSEPEETPVKEADSDRKRRFDALFAAHSSGIVAYCRWRAASPSDAQDAVGDVFLTAWRRLDDLPAGDAARVWLYATARKVLANQRRSSDRRSALQRRLAAETGPHSQEPPLSDREELLVHEALRRLDPNDREVLLLAEWEGLSSSQMAPVLGCLAVTARGRLHRARRRFRGAYEELLAAAEHEPAGSEAPETSGHLHLLRAAPAAAPRAASQVREGGS